MARASLYEVHHWLTRADARRLRLPDDVDGRADEIGRMLNGLIATTRRRAQTQTKN